MFFAPELFFSISLLGGLHVMFNFFREKPLPVYSLAFHIFFFLAGMMLMLVPGYLVQGGILSISALCFILAFIGGIIFTIYNSFSEIRPSKFLGIGYMSFLIIGLILLIV
jgi:hypothetical protein